MEIANDNNLSISRVYIILRKNNSIHGHEQSSAYFERKFGDRNRLIVEQYKTGVPVKQISAQQQLTRARIYAIINAQCSGDSSITQKAAEARANKRKERNAQLIQSIAAHPDKNIAEIATQYGLSAGRAYTIVRNSKREEKERYKDGKREVVRDGDGGG